MFSLWYFMYLLFMVCCLYVFSSVSFYNIVKYLKIGLWYNLVISAITINISILFISNNLINLISIFSILIIYMIKKLIKGYYYLLYLQYLLWYLLRVLY